MLIFIYLEGGGQWLFHLSNGCCQGKSTKQISLATGQNSAKFTQETAYMGFIPTKSRTNLSVSNNKICKCEQLASW